MARRVEDLVGMMRLLVGGDGYDATVIDMPFHDPAQVQLGKLRVAFYTDNGVASSSAEVSRVLQHAAKELTSRHVLVEEARPVCLAEAYHLEMQFIGPDGGDALRAYLRDIGSERLHPLLSGWLDKLEQYRTDLAGFAHYWAALDRYRMEMASFFRDYDAILCPVYVRGALPHGASIEEENFRGFSHTMAYNLTGWPAAVVRCGETEQGLPLGIQIVAHPFREDVALALAGVLEEACGGWKPPSALRDQEKA
jgi:amidase